MREMRILIVSDGRPGHYHLSEGVAAALGRVVPVDVAHCRVRRRRWVPSALLMQMLGRGKAEAVLKLGYALDKETLGPSDIVISAGGDTLFANAAAARILGAQNIFCGTLRKLPAEAFTLIVSSYQRHGRMPRHIVALKPNGMDPDRLDRPAVVPTFGGDNPPQRAALLVGGNSGLFHYEDDEWEALADFARMLTAAWGTRWLISTSRRTSEAASDVFRRLSNNRDVVEQFINYDTAGPGTLPDILGKADVVLATEDSSTMVSEAVCARLPVVGVAPRRHAYKPEEREYRDFMLDKGWCRSIALAELTPDRLGSALAEIRPLEDNHLDLLADQLRAHLELTTEHGA